MDATTSRTDVTPRMGRVLAGLLLVLGIWLIGQGLWIPVKAIAAQWLLQHAWGRDTQDATANQALAMGGHLAGRTIARSTIRHRPDYPGRCQRAIVSLRTRTAFRKCAARRTRDARGERTSGYTFSVLSNICRKTILLFGMAHRDIERFYPFRNSPWWIAETTRLPVMQM